MDSIYKSKLAQVFFSLLRTAPLFVMASMAFRLIFIVMQVASIWFIFSWVGGNVNPNILELIGAPLSSYIYPCLGAAGFVCATVFSLISKICALKGVFKFETRIARKSLAVNEKLTKGDLKNMAKLIISFLEVVVPLGLIFFVSLLWVLITPYSIILVFLIVVSGVWMLKKGAIFSASRYKNLASRNQLEAYVDSEEQRGFYKILLLPNYVSLALITVIAVSMLLSLVATKLYFDSMGGHVGYMSILTAVAFLQMKSFASIVLRAGAYNKSLTAVHRVVITKEALV